MEVPTIISFSSLQQIVEQNVDIPVPRGRVRRLQCFRPRTEVQQRFPSSNSLTFQFLTVKVFKVSCQDRVLRHLLNFQLVLQMTRLMGFSHFSPESATRPLHTGSALPPHSSPWTPPAYAMSMGREEEKPKRRQERQQ